MGSGRRVIEMNVVSSGIASSAETIDGNNSAAKARTKETTNELLYMGDSSEFKFRRSQGPFTFLRGQEKTPDSHESLRSKPLANLPRTSERPLLRQVSWLMDHPSLWFFPNASGAQ